MKHKARVLEAVVVFPVYLKLSPKELEGKTAVEIKKRILELAATVLEENTLDMKGYITQCTSKGFEVSVPSLTKTGFNYSAKGALECGDPTTSVIGSDEDVIPPGDYEDDIARASKHRDPFYYMG